MLQTHSRRLEVTPCRMHQIEIHTAMAVSTAWYTHANSHSVNSHGELAVVCDHIAKFLDFYFFSEI